jgi:hypothetical protein
MSDPSTVDPMDPAQRNSPIMSEVEEEATVVMDASRRACFWNGREYAEGSEVAAAGVIYECSFGNWVKA